MYVPRDPESKYLNPGKDDADILMGLRKEDVEFKASVSYTVRHYLNKNENLQGLSHVSGQK